MGEIHPYLPLSPFQSIYNIWVFTLSSNLYQTLVSRYRNCLTCFNWNLNLTRLTVCLQASAALSSLSSNYRFPRDPFDFCLTQSRESSNNFSQLLPYNQIFTDMNILNLKYWLPEIRWILVRLRRRVDIKKSKEILVLINVRLALL